mmetsp:Transcript_18439/g.39882  ORF Transcript_18439/g.39882 Transcript_18439/m.39882 type:complete len:108 (-) Transcript_18439:55-378(-)
MLESHVCNKETGSGVSESNQWGLLNESFFRTIHSCPCVADLNILSAVMQYAIMVHWVYQVIVPTAIFVSTTFTTTTIVPTAIVPGKLVFVISIFGTGYIRYNNIGST